MKKGHCRLCWCQGRLNRSTELGGVAGTYRLLLPYVRQVAHQQLFLAGLPAHRDLHPKPAAPLRGVGSGAAGVSRRQPPPVVGRPRHTPIQPPLLDTPPRQYQRRIDLRNGPEWDNPWLDWALHLAHRLAERRGFNEPVRGATNRALVMLLADHNPGEMVRRSDIAQALRASGNAVEHTAGVLAEMGILHDDRPDVFQAWLDDKLTGLAPAISSHAGRWARDLRQGTARSKPRTEATVGNYVRALRPILATWSGRYEHLREVHREDVLAALAPLRGHPRQTTLQALRSLMRWAKTRGIIFRDPTTRIASNRTAQPIWQPLSPDEVAPTVAAAASAHAQVAVVLAAVHGARHGEIRNTRLDDVDLSSRRLTIAGRSRPLDDLTYRILKQWLEHRRRHWPNTANPHLLISKESAIRLGPVTHPWLTRILRGLPATLERLRIDRHLDEALASGADPLQVAAVFGFSDTTAIRYANAARHLLNAPPMTTPPRDSPAADGTRDGEEPSYRDNSLLNLPRKPICGIEP
ncbi:integrase [Micromonospora chalcea]